MSNKVTGIILAGGKSSRMGRNKAMLMLQGKYLYRHVLETMQKVVPHILISSNAALAPDETCKIIPDLFPEKGPMGGLYSVMQASDSEVFLVLSCDTPFVPATLLKQLLETPCTQALVPVYKQALFPFPGVYKRSILPMLSQHLENDDLKMKLFLKNIRAQEYVIEEGIFAKEQTMFTNINTPEDYTQALL